MKKDTKSMGKNTQGAKDSKGFQKGHERLIRRGEKAVRGKRHRERAASRKWGKVNRKKKMQRSVQPEAGN